MLRTETADEARDSQSLSTAEFTEEEEERGRDLELLPLGAEDSLVPGPQWYCTNPSVLLLWPGRADTALLSERSLLCFVDCICFYCLLLTLLHTCTSSSPTPLFLPRRLGALQIETTHVYVLLEQIDVSEVESAEQRWVEKEVDQGNYVNVKVYINAALVWQQWFKFSGPNLCSFMHPKQPSK